MPMPSLAKQFGIGRPKPARRTNQSWPFLNMAVGDSVLIPRTQRRMAANAATALGRARGWKFTCQTSDEGSRFWRTK